MTKQKVQGNQVDPYTRCTHYHSTVDIIAIKFYCCNEYYACYYCHQELANHTTSKWPKNQWNERAILCGNCHHELTIHDYMNASACPQCESSFNEKCIHHFHLYFDT
ncbi:CHY zinc finger protein [Halobacillus seohaensis]|uniref:CHY zinc finger protein n=1 Tax=Halobacillus seohaensis TaxID=447421 RepID=A0ABW2EIV2_9BACI